MTKKKSNKKKTTRNKKNNFSKYIPFIFIAIIVILIGNENINSETNNSSNQVATQEINNEVVPSNNLEVLSSSGKEKKLETNLLKSHGVMSFRPIDIMKDPMTLMSVWIDNPIPLEMYSPAEKKIQKEINSKVDTAIWTYSPQRNQVYPDNYKLPMIERNVDNEEITPYTWKWLTFEKSNADGSKTTVDLRRPNWWINYYEATGIGNEVWLSISEMGIEGIFSVTNVRPNQLDTRFWDEKRKGDHILRPITGKFVHESDDVWLFYFNNSKDPIGATSNHPFWSLDQKAWIPVGNLKIGEKVKSKDGKITTLVSKIKKDGREKVYNIEIFRDHNYFVGEQGLLVHNGCTAGNFPKGQKSIKKVLGVDEKDIHPIKDVIKKQFKLELREAGIKNPDIGIDELGNLLLKDPTSNTVIQTNTKWVWFIGG